MIFLYIIDLVAVNYDSIRFLLSWVTPVWSSLKFINSENQNDKHHSRVLNDENFWGSLIKWFGLRFMLTFRSIDCLTSKWIINRLCAVYIILRNEWTHSNKKTDIKIINSHKTMERLLRQWFELWSILWFWRVIKHVLIFQKVRAPKSANVVIRHRFQ